MLHLNDEKNRHQKLSFFCIYLSDEYHVLQPTTSPHAIKSLSNLGYSEVFDHLRTTYLAISCLQSVFELS